MMEKKTLNKLKRRDKKRNPHRMRVDDSARKLAQIKYKSRISKYGPSPPWQDDPYDGRSRPD